MPQCKNIPSKYYTGEENTPLGRGYSSSGEKIGSRRVGLDGQKYVAIKWGKGKRWKKIVSRAKNRRGFFDRSEGSEPSGYFTEKETDFHDMPDEMLFQISDNFDCDEMLAFRASSKRNKEIIDANIKRFYLAMRERYPDQFPEINLDDYDNEALVMKIISLCNDRYRRLFLNAEDVSEYYKEELDPRQLRIAGRLMESGAEDNIAFVGARDLNNEQVENMIRLMESGARDNIAFVGAGDLNNEQVENMIRLMKSGARDNIAFMGRVLNNEQVENMIRLMESGAEDNIAFVGAKSEY